MGLQRHYCAWCPLGSWTEGWPSYLGDTRHELWTLALAIAGMAKFYTLFLLLVIPCILTYPVQGSSYRFVTNPKVSRDLCRWGDCYWPQCASKRALMGYWSPHRVSSFTRQEAMAGLTIYIPNIHENIMVKTLNVCGGISPPQFPQCRYWAKGGQIKKCRMRRGESPAPTPIPLSASSGRSGAQVNSLDAGWAFTVWTGMFVRASNALIHEQLLNFLSDLDEF